MNLFKEYENCLLCPRKCGINRYTHQGVCKETAVVSIANALLHFGEEPPVTGTNGSGTIFFTGCGLKCVYCQNYQISQEQRKYNIGKNYSVNQLASLLIDLQNKKAHNINFVTPTHFYPSIREAVLIAKKNKLNIPIISNTGGYELPEIINEYADIFDIYLVDMKYSDSELAGRMSHATDYFNNNIKAISTMLKHAGNLLIDEKGIAQKGVIIRHLVLPNHLDNSFGVLSAIKENFGTDLFLSIMFQYSPQYQANKFSDIFRRVNNKEANMIHECLEQLGFHNGWVQELASNEIGIPDFSIDKPFIWN